MVSLAGEHDVPAVRGLRDELISAVSPGPQRLVVDLAGVAFMDTASARVLELTGSDQRIRMYCSVVRPKRPVRSDGRAAGPGPGLAGSGGGQGYASCPVRELA